MNPFKKTFSLKINNNLIAVMLILCAEICFYKMETLYLYLFISGLGIIISFANNIKYFSLNVKNTHYVLWLLSVYFIYFCYGFLYLQKGEFPWDTLSYRCVESIALYIALRQEIRCDPYKIAIPFITAGIFSLIYLIILEKDNLFQGGIRLGSTLSGNENTVGFNFGIITTIITWWYCKEKKKWKVFVLALFSGIILLTGSKKALIILVFDLLLLFMSEKNITKRWIKICMITLLGIYVIYNVPYIYEIIGVRVESMMQTLLFGTSAQTYSYSTEVRTDMIIEGFNFFRKHPILGGGWNYFYANTIYGYEYSHCNYIEILCSFGIIGFVIYYSQHLHIFLFTFKKMLKHHFLYYDYLLLAFIYILTSIVLDLAVVSFSAQCVWYIPITISSAFIDEIREKSGNVKRIAKK